MTEKSSSSIRELIDDWSKALCEKNLDRLMSHYSSDVVVFDIKPPLSIKGVEQWRKQWELCFPHFPSSFEIEFKDLIVHVDGNVAFAFWNWRFNGDFPMKTWFRATVGFKRENDRWLIVHEHASLPFDPQTSKVVFNLDDSIQSK